LEVKEGWNMFRDPPPVRVLFNFDWLVENGVEKFFEYFGLTEGDSDEDEESWRGEGQAYSCDYDYGADDSGKGKLIQLTSPSFSCEAVEIW